MTLQYYKILRPTVVGGYIFTENETDDPGTLDLAVLIGVDGVEYMFHDQRWHRAYIMPVSAGCQWYNKWYEIRQSPVLCAALDEIVSGIEA